MEKKKYSGRGGNRGGGRPKTGPDRKTKSFHIDLDLCEYLQNEVDNQDAFVNIAIRSYKEGTKKIQQSIN